MGAGWTREGVLVGPAASGFFTALAADAGALWALSYVFDRSQDAFRSLRLLEL
jgi:hypothetical protein